MQHSRELGRGFLRERIICQAKMADGIWHRLLDIADHGGKSGAFDIHISELGVAGLLRDLKAKAERRLQR